MPQTVERMFRLVQNFEQVTLAGTAPLTARVWTGRPIAAGAGGLIAFPPHNLDFQEIFDTRTLGALRAPTSRWRPFGPLDFVLRALRALRPCDPRKVDQHLLFHLVDA